MTIDLTGQLAAVTGAASGIGRAIAKAFVEAGASVLALDLNEKGLVELESILGTSVIACPADITDLSALESLADKHAVDHLICAAAIGSGKGGFPFWNLHPDDWKSVVEVTLLGTVKTLHAFTPSLRRGDTQRKSVLVLASVAGQIGSQTDPPYSAAKAALINFTQCAAKDLAADGIRVNAVSPGMVDTPLNRSVFESHRESPDQTFEEWAKKKIRHIAPLARWQKSEEFGAMAVYLASDHGRNITGQTLNIDGGQVMHS
ncbi:MAG: SDR family oxidoreductase [Verrucomicrobiota bacterium]